MQGKTLVKLFKNQKELPPYLAIGPIIKPYQGEDYENEVIFELETIPEELRYLGVGHTAVKVKTPEKEILHKLLLKPEGIYDEWFEDIKAEPQINDALINILGNLISHLNDQELRKAVEGFCNFLLPKTGIFARKLNELQEIALKEPVWFIQIYDYKPLEDVYVFDTASHIELSNTEFETHFLIVSPSKRMEIPSIKNLEYAFFRKLWGNLNRGFAVELILTPEIFRLTFKVFGASYLRIWKDFDKGEIYRELLSQSPMVKALIRGLVETNPLDFVGPSIFGKELLESRFGELLEVLKEVSK